MIKGLLAVFTAFYVIEYCEDHAVPGIMNLAHCSTPGCNTVYRESCGHITKRRNLEEALKFINTQEIRGFRFQGLYTVSNVSLHLEPRKKKRIVLCQKEEEYEVNEWVY
jgi:hypothetical protein